MKLWTSENDIMQRDINPSFQGTTPRVFSIFGLIVFGVGNSLAVGTSVLIGEITKCVAGPAVVVSIFLAGVTAFVGGLCLAEFGVQFLKVDSAYPYSYCWGKSTEAFIFGWALIAVHAAGSASVAKGIISFIDALSDYKIAELLKNTSFISLSDVFPYFDYFSLAIVILFTILIAFGFKDSIILRKLLTICSLVLLISIIVAGAFEADVKNWENVDQNSEGKNGFAPFGGLGVVKGAAIALYGFIGFEACSFSGHEIKKRKKNLPLAILATIFVTLVIYLGIAAILTLILPYTNLFSYAAVPFAFQQIGWSALKWVAIIAPFFGFPTSFFGIAFPLPSIIHSMANDGLLFHCLGNDHPRFKTPILAIITGGLLAAIGAGFFTFRTLVNLTVIGALFIYTILAINVILLRYFPKNEDNENDFWKNVLCSNSKVSLKAVLKNIFNFKEKQPTDLTKAIIMGNLVLFCICSLGLGIIFIIFYDLLIKCTAEAVVPASILLCIMFFNLMSMCCQPKSQEIVPFKVPLFPFIPCLSIFLNIFLIITFDSLTWILFSSWMLIGVIPYFFWTFWKCQKGELGKTSLYEINRTNAVKLNESIWKIKTDKKSFYEGAINPVFSNDFDDIPNDKKENSDVEVKKLNEKTKQDEIIQREELDLEKNLKLQVNFIAENVEDQFGDESEKVQWECVAEIHTEEEFSPENIALEIVDNTYNFLSEVSEEIGKDGVIEEKPESDALNPLELSETSNKHLVNEQEIFKEKLINKNEVSKSKDEQKELKTNLESKIPTVLPKSDLQRDPFFKSAPPDPKLSLSDKNEDDEKLVYLLVETFYEAHQSEMLLKQNNATEVANTDTKAIKPVLDEQNKIKDFKEKLNQLLKNQINNAVFFSNNSSLSKSVDADNSELNKEKEKDAIHNSIKTLNKSQIKNQLELLLAKKPPQRPSLKSSFNINLKETEKENKSEKTNESTQNNSILNDSGKEEDNEKPSSVLVNSIREKILALKSVDSETNDICC